LIDAAKTAAQSWRFKPTQLNGKPVGFIGRITFNFTLDGGAADSKTRPGAISPQQGAAREYDPAEWKEFSPPDKSFTIQFPGIPTESSPPGDSASGGKRYLFGLTGGLALYWITYFDLPQPVHDEAEPEGCSTVRSNLY
jgi:hypothetical protein